MNMIPYLLMNLFLTGNKILDSPIVQGIMNLFQDGIVAAQWIGGIFVILVFILISIRKSKEEQADRKQYTSWQIALVVAFVLILGAQEIFDLVGSYFTKG
ncbi:MAG: hypothetical protein IJ040_08510 [Lachnospiraceae bacterium]|nr:hypothetical protein [Lachnospiraceae bacterium]